MGRILVVEADTVFSTLVEDRLREAGYQVELCENEDQALLAASRGRSDCIVLDLSLPMIAGRDFVRAIRAQGHVESTPILALSDPIEAEVRLEILRAGASELLERPIHLEELVFRVERLTRSGSADPVVLEGRLTSNPLWELLQMLADSRRRGRLLLWNRWGGGSLVLGSNGRVLAAAWEGLLGSEALLALLGMEDGAFRFVAEAAPAGSDTDEAGLEIRRALLEAAWIRDELERREASVPGTGAPLRLATGQVPEPEPELPVLPARELLDRIGERPGIRLFDLMAQSDAAPQRVRLAAAWLLDAGAIEVDASRVEGAATASTLEIAQRAVLDAALDDLLYAVRQRGVTHTPVPILLLAEREAWPVLRQLFGVLADRWRSDSLHALVEELETRSGGSCLLEAAEGEVALHLQVLDDASMSRLGAIVPACAGVVVWLDGEGDSEPFRRVLDRLELSQHGVGFAVATHPEAFEAIRRAVAACPAWRAVPEAPRNLLAVLRLIRGRVSDRPDADLLSAPSV